VVRIGGDRLVGTFVGFYYFFSVGAQIVSPILVGFLIDQAGYQILFIYCCAAFLAAFGLLLFVRHGEDNVPEKTTATEVLDAMGD